MTDVKNAESVFLFVNVHGILVSSLLSQALNILVWDSPSVEASFQPINSDQTARHTACQQRGAIVTASAIPCHSMHTDFLRPSTGIFSRSCGALGITIQLGIRLHVIFHCPCFRFYGHFFALLALAQFLTVFLIKKIRAVNVIKNLRIEPNAYQRNKILQHAVLFCVSVVVHLI